MPGPPRTDGEARKWVRDAVEMQSYTPGPHFLAQLRARSITMPDVLRVLKQPRSVVPTTDVPRHGGTAWRLLGHDLDDARMIGVGVETYVDDELKCIFLCTAIVEGKL
jgi:hypothetical protein